MSRATDRQIDALSFTFGLIFLGLAGLWLASRIVTLDVVVVGWFVVGGLIALGAAGIVVTAVRSVRHADDLEE